MIYSKINYSKSPLKEYKVFASKIPTEKEPIPQVYSANVFVKNVCYARAAMQKMLTKQYKIKPSGCLILDIKEVPQENDFVFRNYGIKFTYRTKSGIQNAYKEVRNMNRVLAVSDLICEFGSRHKVKANAIKIIEVKQISDNEVTKARVLSYIGEDVMFPVFHKVPNTVAECVPADTKLFI